MEVQALHVPWLLREGGVDAVVAIVALIAIVSLSLFLWLRRNPPPQRNRGTAITRSAAGNNVTEELAPVRTNGGFSRWRNVGLLGN